MKIVRYLNALAVIALVASAGYAYSIKYETILYAERIQKIKNANKKLIDQIGMLRAELAHLTRPERLQALAEQHLDLKQLDLAQVGTISELPDRPPRTDSIGRKLEMLGLAEPTNTPGEGTSAPLAGAKPASKAQARSGATPSSNRQAPR